MLKIRLELNYNYGGGLTAVKSLRAFRYIDMPQIPRVGDYIEFEGGKFGIGFDAQPLYLEVCSVTYVVDKGYVVKVKEWLRETESIREKAARLLSHGWDAVAEGVTIEDLQLQAANARLSENESRDALTQAV